MEKLFEHAIETGFPHGLREGLRFGELSKVSSFGYPRYEWPIYIVLTTPHVIAKRDPYFISSRTAQYILGPRRPSESSF